jgi:hypothetical protein
MKGRCCQLLSAELPQAEACSQLSQLKRQMIHIFNFLSMIGAAVVFRA